ncbi:PH domain-containing protein [Streptomyces filamentosus]|uniref:PH domain-containing protein n=1 Tax=Streptomyces filamentosus TaxID=67294 RepID=UPI0036ECA994
MTGSSALPRTYRISPGRTRGMIGAIAFSLLLGGIPMLVQDGVPGWVRWLVLALLVAFAGWGVHAARQLSTSADLKGIRVRGFVRDRRIAWEDVQDIRAVPNPGAGMAQGQPQTISYVYGRDGSRLQLFYVDDNHVRVEREVDALRAAWEELRGEDWTPDARAAELIDRRDGREENLQRAFGWSVGSLMVLIVLFVVLLLTDNLFMDPLWILIGPVAVFLAVWLGGRYRSR